MGKKSVKKEWRNEVHEPVARDDIPLSSYTSVVFDVHGPACLKITPVGFTEPQDFEPASFKGSNLDYPHGKNGRFKVQDVFSKMTIADGFVNYTIDHKCITHNPISTFALNLLGYACDEIIHEIRDLDYWVNIKDVSKFSRQFKVAMSLTQGSAKEREAYAYLCQSDLEEAKIKAHITSSRTISLAYKCIASCFYISGIQRIDPYPASQNGISCFSIDTMPVYLGDSYERISVLHQVEFPPISEMKFDNRADYHRYVMEKVCAEPLGMVHADPCDPGMHINRYYLPPYRRGNFLDDGEDLDIALHSRLVCMLQHIFTNYTGRSFYAFDLGCIMPYYMSRIRKGKMRNIPLVFPPSFVLYNYICVFKKVPKLIARMYKQVTNKYSRYVQKKQFKSAKELKNKLDIILSDTIRNCAAIWYNTVEGQAARALIETGLKKFRRSKNTSYYVYFPIRMVENRTDLYLNDFIFSSEGVLIVEDDESKLNRKGAEDLNSADNYLTVDPANFNEVFNFPISYTNMSTVSYEASKSALEGGPIDPENVMWIEWGDQHLLTDLTSIIRSLRSYGAGSYFTTAYVDRDVLFQRRMTVMETGVKRGEDGWECQADELMSDYLDERPACADCLFTYQQDFGHSFISIFYPLSGCMCHHGLGYIPVLERGEELVNESDLFLKYRELNEDNTIVIWFKGTHFDNYIYLNGKYVDMGNHASRPNPSFLRTLG